MKLKIKKWKPCKTRGEIIERYRYLVRESAGHHLELGLPDVSVYGIDNANGGRYTLDDICEALGI